MVLDNSALLPPALRDGWLSVSTTYLFGVNIHLRLRVVLLNVVHYN